MTSKDKDKPNLRQLPLDRHGLEVRTLQIGTHEDDFSIPKDSILISLEFKASQEYINLTEAGKRILSEDILAEVAEVFSTCQIKSLTAFRSKVRETIARNKLKKSLKVLDGKKED